MDRFLSGAISARFLRGRGLAALSACVACLLPGPGQGEEERDPPSPGDLYREQIEDLPYPVLVHVPGNYSAERRWPVLVFYHGTSGQPSLQLLEDYTGGKDFVLIGMTYVRKGRFQYSEENLQEEIEACHRTIERVAARCRIDRKRIYVGGFSKGGWVSAMLIDHDHRFAGGFVLGGGVYDRQLYQAEKFKKRTPVYIGVGQRDGNTVMSLNAKVHFRDLGGEVTLDVWPEIGHEWPIGKHRSPAFRQWIEMITLEDRPQAHRGRMGAWFARELAVAKLAEDPLERYVDLLKLADMPAVAFLGDAARRQITALLEGLRSEEPVKTEWEVQQQYRRIVRYELRNRYLETIKKCSQAYLALSRKHPDRIYGKQAAIDYKRTQYLIRHTESRRKEIEAGKEGGE